MPERSTFGDLLPLATSRVLTNIDSRPDFAELEVSLYVVANHSYHDAAGLSTVGTIVDLPRVSAPQQEASAPTLV
jgi:hypothetical protein